MMKLEYLHGVRVTKLVHEMSPLEAAIHSYEETARRTLDRYGTLAKSHAASNLTKTEIERNAELNECLKF